MRFKFQKLKLKLDEKGQTLVEVLVAMATAVAVLSAIAITVISSLSNVEFTKNQNLATQYSREGLEVVRRLARSNWNTFEGFNAQDYCLAKGQTTLTPMGPNGCGQNVDTFMRKIEIEQTSLSCQEGSGGEEDEGEDEEDEDGGGEEESNARITSIVSWSDSKCGAANVFCHEVTLDSCIANLNPVYFEIPDGNEDEDD